MGREGGGHVRGVDKTEACRCVERDAYSMCVSLIGSGSKGRIRLFWARM